MTSHHELEESRAGSNKESRSKGIDNTTYFQGSSKAHARSRSLHPGGLWRGDFGFRVSGLNPEGGVGGEKTCSCGALADAGAAAAAYAGCCACGWPSYAGAGAGGYAGAACSAGGYCSCSPRLRGEGKARLTGRGAQRMAGGGRVTGSVRVFFLPWLCPMAGGRATMPATGPD